MNAMKHVFDEILGMFVDDGSLAIAILILVGFSALLAETIGFPLMAGVVLFAGCLVILIENVVRATRRG
ncbi:hypothetical protein [Methyloraptor flagellatus]|uniref:Uncharacterized protein n=1 Tax=Methyloraptor flagellatus TaxID=3162530 RepID=A0AAU7XHE3_9HYPH